MRMLEIQGLCRSFGGVQAVCDLTTGIEDDSITSMIGPNGAGKTTAFNMVTGLLPPSTGRIFFEKTDITRMPPHRIAALGIGRTFQNIRIFPHMSALENVMVGMHTRSRTGMIAAAFCLPGVRREERFIRDEAMKQLAFSGLEPYAGLPAGSLAFGQQRLLEIARALVSSPKLLLLDEPAAGLNSQETLKLADLIRSIRDSGITVFLVEHDMELVMNISDSVIVLDNGVLITHGTPSDVQNNPEVIAAYLGEESHA